MNLALNCWFYQCYNTRMLNAKLLPYYFTYYYSTHGLQWTITRFIADDKVVHQWVRWVIRLASDNSWAQRRMKHMSWKLRWIILCTLERRMAVSCKISRAHWCLLVCTPDLSMRFSTATRWMHGLPLTCCRTIVPVLWILLSRLSILPTFQPLSGNWLNTFVHHTALTES